MNWLDLVLIAILVAAAFLGMKFGLANPEENGYGGVYIFEDDASLEAFLASPILKEYFQYIYEYKLVYYLLLYTRSQLYLTGDISPV